MHPHLALALSSYLAVSTNTLWVSTLALDPWALSWVHTWKATTVHASRRDCRKERASRFSLSLSLSACLLFICFPWHASCSGTSARKQTALVLVAGPPWPSRQHPLLVETGYYTTNPVYSVRPIMPQYTHGKPLFGELSFLFPSPTVLTQQPCLDAISDAAPGLRRIIALDSSTARGPRKAPPVSEVVVHSFTREHG